MLQKGAANTSKHRAVHQCNNAKFQSAFDRELSSLKAGLCMQAQDAERLASTGSVSLVFGGLIDDYELHLHVAETIYETAVACNLHVQ
jgi:hypothetical protein